MQSISPRGLKLRYVSSLLFARRLRLPVQVNVVIRHGQSHRSLFELHAGRREHELPADLFIDESQSLLNEKNKQPRATSRDLVEALGPIGVEYETPKEHIHKNDLSYSNALTALLDSKKAREEVEINSKSGRDSRWGLHPKDVLVYFLRYTAPVLEFQARSDNANTPQLDGALRKLIPRRNELYIEKRGWDVTDLMDWAWILTASTAELAAARLACIGRMGLEGNGKHKVIPQFVSTFLLRRRSINGPALSEMISYLSSYMAWLSEKRTKVDEEERLGSVTVQNRSGQQPQIKDFIFMIIIVRLLRNARRVMPAACESIVSLLCRYVDDSLVVKYLQKEEDGVENHIAALTFTYNSALALVAYPASLQPFRSATHQQRAQFMILRRMTQYDPPLLVDRRGYRAVTRIQLMQKKTSSEREWAVFKALSWPPWKEERLGIDADIGPEFGISQAKEVLNQAMEAGYSADDWDDAASILAGWDTDDSPTIQTRAILKGKIPTGTYRRGVKQKSDRFKSMVWAARIKATRTLQEAWAAFLSYEDSGVDKYEVVYYAMFEKLFHDAKRRLSARKVEDTTSGNQDSHQSLPGDGLEVSPTPIAPHHTVYNRTSPPSIRDFFERMVHSGIEPKAQGSFLSMLLRNAPTLALGLRFLTASTLPRKHTIALLAPPGDADKDWSVQWLLEDVPVNTFAAVISFLTRADWDRRVVTNGLDFSKPDRFLNGKWTSFGQKPAQVMPHLWRPASQAIRLMLLRQPRERSPWYAVLAALARSGVVSPLNTCSKFKFNTYSAIANWKTTCTILNIMEDLDVKHDLGVMKILCTGLEKAIFEAEDVTCQGNDEGGLEDDLRGDLELVFDVGPSRIKNIFKDVVRSERMQQDIPQSVLKNQDLEESASYEGSGATSPLPSGDDDNTEDLDEDLEDDLVPSSHARDNLLPPACLIPKLLEVPDPSQLHSFMRILGLRRDYGGMLDLIEWMALYSDELRSMRGEQRNGLRMMRRCLTATRAFMERSWLSYRDAGDGTTSTDEIGKEIDPAPKEIWQAVRDVIMETQHWGGWPTDAEVEQYCLNGRFL